MHRQLRKLRVSLGGRFMNKQKKKRVIAAVVAIVIVAALVLTMVAGFLGSAF